MRKGAQLSISWRNELEICKNIPVSKFSPHNQSLEPNLISTVLSKTVLQNSLFVKFDTKDRLWVEILKIEFSRDPWLSLFSFLKFFFSDHILMEWHVCNSTIFTSFLEAMIRQSSFGISPFVDHVLLIYFWTLENVPYCL